MKKKAINYGFFLIFALYNYAHILNISVFYSNIKFVKYRFFLIFLSFFRTDSSFSIPILKSTLRKASLNLLFIDFLKDRYF